MPKIHSCAYRPKHRKLKMKWENSLHMGLELELNHISLGWNNDREEDLKEVDKVIKSNSQYVRPFYYKEDGSLDNGVEFVSRPMTLQYIHNRVNMNEILEFIKKKTQFKSQDNCGIHVHLDRSFFSDTDIEKMRIFFSMNKESLSKFSRRKQSNLDRWAQFEKGYSIKEFLHGSAKPEHHYIEHQRNFACSLATHTAKKTIELRLFASTINHKRLVSIFQFCDALGYFMKSHSIVAVAKKNSWKTFVNWVEQTNRYGHLMEEFENVGLAS